MTAPDPPTVAIVPAEAVKAAAKAMFDGAGGQWDELVPDQEQDFWWEWATEALAAALPHLRAQVLAEVDAALRGKGGYMTGWEAADYLRNTLAADAGEVGTSAAPS